MERKNDKDERERGSVIWKSLAKRDDLNLTTTTTESE